MMVDLASTWTYRGRDSCAEFFTQMLRASRPSVPDTACVLEIGCAEFDWLTVARSDWPHMTLTGIDWRGSKRDRPGVTVIAGDVMAHPFTAEAFDWVVAISTIEHIGLGHYRQDPLAEHGDSITLRKVWGWLRPGGLLTFDVPWNGGVGTYEVFRRTKHRIYDTEAVESRLAQGLPWDRQWTGAAHASRSSVLLADTPPLAGGVHCYNRGFVWRKPDQVRPV